jgi:hypothetical protein
MQLEMRDPSGRLRRIIRWPGARLPVSPGDIDRQGACSSGSAGTGMQRAQLDSVWRAIPKPDSLPAIIGLVPDPGRWSGLAGAGTGDTEAECGVLGGGGVARQWRLPTTPRRSTFPPNDQAAHRRRESHRAVEVRRVRR